VPSELALWEPETAVAPPGSGDPHPAAVYLARLGPGSRRAMRQALDTIAAILTGGTFDADGPFWPALRYPHTAAVRAALAGRYRPATANKMLAALRGVLQECWRLGLMSAEEYQRARDLKTIKAETLPRGRALTLGEIGSLFAVCAQDPRPAGARDAALIAVLYGGGLRRSEAVQLNLADYTPASAEIRVLAGKGRKDRVLFLTGGAAEALNDWLALRGDEPGPLFYAVRKGGAVVPRRLTDQAVMHILAQRGEQCGVLAFAPHDLRRSFITDLLEAGADTFVVQQLAGHSDPKTTKRYDRRGEGAKRKAAQLLHVPYFRRRRE
jgi:site-specific recombinase XerD